jgi:histidinol-phosphate aminotransferase
LDVVERLLRLPLVVVVDEAYVEFGRPAAGRSPERSEGTAGEPTMLPLLARHENLVILRTFSKWAGLAGLRLGYALMAAELAGYLDRIRAPYNVNAAAVIAALATFEDLETVQGNVARLVAEREGLQGALAEIPWLDPLPSQANFILCRVRGQSGAELARALAGRGILVRSFSEPGLEACVRISVGRPEQNGALLEALRSLILL